MFTVGSLFDGSGGFPLAAFMCGGVPVWASEIEPYPIAVTKSRFPYVKHLGSVTDINGGEIDPVDVITFGSPCQDLSVAGLRKGLKHEDNGDDETTRSGLFMEAVRIIKEMREATGGKYPRFAFWENVPGAFSSNKGEDFRVVCEELIKIVEPSAVMPPVPKAGWAYADHYCGDGWSLAYRVLDAQFWGVPQRRKRIFLIVDLGGERAGEILFKRDGLRGYFEEGRTPWQGVTGNAAGCVGTADCEGIGINGEVATTLDASYYKGCGMRQGIEREVVAVPAYGRPLGFRPENVRVYEETATTLCNGTRPGFTNGVIEAVPVAYSLDPLSSNSMKSSNPYSGCRRTDVARTIDTTDPNPSKNQGGIAILQPVNCVIGLDCYNQSLTGDKAKALTGAATDSDHVPCIIDTHILDDQGGSQISVRDDGKCPTLRAEMHGNIPCVMDAAGFKELNSAKARSDAYEHEVAPCLSANKHDASVCIKCYDIGEARLRTPSEYTEVAPTITARCGTGGNNVPAVVYDARGNGDGSTASTITGDHENRITDYTSVVIEPMCCIDGDKIGKAERSGGSGLGIRSGDKMYTLTAKDAGTHSVCYSNTYQKVTGPLMANSHPGSYTGQDAYTDMLVVGEERNCMHDQQAVVYRQGGFAEYVEGEVGTLRASGGDFGGGSENLICTQYIVRRLTPTECARLQGFPDDWGHPDKKTEFADEEYEFWLNVRNTHAEINGKPTKSYTRDQMLTWYNKLRTDSSEYKMWGNGIALPCALYVMQGIAEVFK